MSTRSEKGSSCGGVDGEAVDAATCGGSDAGDMENERQEKRKRRK
jgi:hypothetical protein